MFDYQRVMPYFFIAGITVALGALRKAKNRTCNLYELATLVTIASNLGIKLGHRRDEGSSLINGQYQ